MLLTTAKDVKSTVSFVIGAHHCGIYILRILNESAPLTGLMSAVSAAAMTATGVLFSMVVMVTAPDMGIIRQISR